jgi:two-component system, chemotaxis family, sensor kinase CheA
MDEALNKNAADLRQITEQLAMELVYAEPGKDTGLLPVNCFLSQIEEISAAAPLPPPLPQAISLGRQWLEAIFNTTGLYDADSLKRLTAWCEWMQSACEMIATDVPPPALPPAWSIAPLSVSTPVSSSQPTTPPALPDQDDVPLTINIDRDAELLREFMSESHEHLQNIELGVLTLEENPNDVETLRSIFRAFHTFKGGSGLLNLVPVNRLAHELESLLDLARQGKLAIDSSVINLILAGGDLLGQFTTAIENQLSGASSPAPILIPIRHIIAKVRAVVQAPHTVAAATVPVTGLTPNPV